VYVGRLSPEKGVRVLLEAWRQMEGLPLTIVGAGPEEAALRAAGSAIPGVRFTGRLSSEGVRRELAAALFLVAPSLCWESFGLAVAEAMAAGKAAIAAAPSALAELVEPGRTGLHFASGDALALARACKELAADPGRAAAMGREARVRWEDELAPEPAIVRRLALYERVIANVRGH
jgi:glycosyltransferase involved in cell wall biosynthesis